MTFNNQKTGLKKGFGILEVLVSAVIIIIVLSALVFIGNAALSNSVYTQQRAQAIYLAQEGIEQVRQMRDTNWIDGNNSTQWNALLWNSGKTALTDITPALGNTLDVQKGSAPMANRYGLVQTTLPEISINGTDYTRSVNVASVGSLLPTDISGGANDVNKSITALKITVSVSWVSKMGSKAVSSSEIITNWRPNY